MAGWTRFYTNVRLGRRICSLRFLAVKNEFYSRAARKQLVKVTQSRIRVARVPSRSLVSHTYRTTMAAEAQVSFQRTTRYEYRTRKGRGAGVGRAARS